MSTTNETTSVESVVNDNLDDFSAELFGQSKASNTEETTSEGEAEDMSDESVSDASNTDEKSVTHDDDSDDDEQEDTTSEEEDEPAPEPVLTLKPKKNRFQERIDTLTGQAREAERREQALRAEFEALKAQLATNSTTANKVVEDQNTGPDPNAKLEDGTEKYPLGEYDPQYIRDITRFTIEEERKALAIKDAEAAEAKAIQEQKDALQTNWNEKLGPAQERYPDFHSKSEELISTFENITEQYGEYLTATLMSMDYGPDVLYYLASNLDEARKIVDSGPAKATISLGRLEAKFADAEEIKQKARPKISNAPTPPSHQNRGSAVNVGKDLDDLDVFASELFTKKKRG